MTRVPPVALTGDAFADVVREEIATLLRLIDEPPPREQSPQYAAGVRAGHEAGLRALAFRLGLTTRQFDALKAEVRLLGAAYPDAPRQADQTDEQLADAETANASATARRALRRVPA